MSPSSRRITQTATAGPARSPRENHKGRSSRGGHGDGNVSTPVRESSDVSDIKLHLRHMIDKIVMGKLVQLWMGKMAPLDIKTTTALRHMLGIRRGQSLTHQTRK